MSGSGNKRYGSIPKATQEIVIEDFAPTLDIHKPAGKFPAIQKRRRAVWYHVDNKYNPTTIIGVYIRSGRRNEWMQLDLPTNYDFWRSNTGTLLPDGTTDTSENIGRNGSVGIGITNPITLLNVQNTPSTNANVALFKSLNGTGGYAVRGESVNSGGALGVYGELGVWDGSRRSGVRGNSSLFTAPAITGFSTIPNGLSAFFNERVGVGTQTPESDLHIVGSVSNSVIVINSTTTLNDTHNKVVVQNGATNITITLPNALTCVGRVYQISRYAGSTGSITVVGSGSQIQALAGTVGATTTLGAHNAQGAGLKHSFTAVNVGGVGVRVRL